MRTAERKRGGKAYGGGTARGSGRHGVDVGHGTTREMTSTASRMQRNGGLRQCISGGQTVGSGGGARRGGVSRLQSSRVIFEQRRQDGGGSRS